MVALVEVGGCGSPGEGTAEAADIEAHVFLRGGDPIVGGGGSEWGMIHTPLVPMTASSKLYRHSTHSDLDEVRVLRVELLVIVGGLLAKPRWETRGYIGTKDRELDAWWRSNVARKRGWRRCTQAQLATFDSRPFEVTDYLKRWANVFPGVVRDYLFELPAPLPSSAETRRWSNYLTSGHLGYKVHYSPYWRVGVVLHYNIVRRAARTLEQKRSPFGASSQCARYLGFNNGVDELEQLANVANLDSQAVQLDDRRSDGLTSEMFILPVRSGTSLLVVPGPPDIFHSRVFRPGPFRTVGHILILEHSSPSSSDLVQLTSTRRLAPPRQYQPPLELLLLQPRALPFPLLALLSSRSCSRMSKFASAAAKSWNLEAVMFDTVLTLDTAPHTIPCLSVRRFRERPCVFHRYADELLFWRPVGLRENRSLGLLWIHLSVRRILFTVVGLGLVLWL
ncbi:hypothetical protein BCR34DRAFT_599543 [Clohesyomyces aquaticus]|uniref:Uncharacterized protein n=1 Tax=Clohesyomyces aquaticus TaxID=1231657 RepID=A0A1Y1ZUP9_9PLEO|nr:hypothetical protein BCR34DRAFT_599543 [Clohesyomyces aquaticus]